jgi:hypothetical protein
VRVRSREYRAAGQNIFNPAAGGRKQDPVAYGDFDCVPASNALAGGKDVAETWASFGYESGRDWGIDFSNNRLPHGRGSVTFDGREIIVILVELHPFARWFPILYTRFRQCFAQFAPGMGF